MLPLMKIYYSTIIYHGMVPYTMVYHGLPVSIYRGSTMVYPGKTHGIPWYTMVYQVQNTMVYHAFYHGLPVSKYHGIPCFLPWFTSFKIPWYTMHFTMVYQFQNIMIDHGIPWVLPCFTSFKIPWYTMLQFTMVQIHHGTIVPWYNVPFS